MTWRSKNIDVLKEEHHRHYGRDWAIGLDHFRLLVGLGLNDKSSLLDVGCGAMRTGIHVAKLVDKYVGVDGHKESIDAAKFYEIPLNHLEGRNIELYCNDKFEVPEQTFDFIFIFSVFIHLKEEERIKLTEAINRYSHDETIVVINNRMNNEIQRYFKVIREVEQQSWLTNDVIKYYILKK